MVTHEISLAELRSDLCDGQMRATLGIVTVPEGDDIGDPVGNYVRRGPSGFLICVAITGGKTEFCSLAGIPWGQAGSEIVPPLGATVVVLTSQRYLLAPPVVVSVLSTFETDPPELRAGEKERA